MRRLRERGAREPLGRVELSGVVEAPRFAEGILG